MNRDKIIGFRVTSDMIKIMKKGYKKTKQTKSEFIRSAIISYCMDIDEAEKIRLEEQK